MNTKEQNEQLEKGAFAQMEREQALHKVIDEHLLFNSQKISYQLFDSENHNEHINEPALDNRKVNREIKDLQQRAHIYKTRLIAIEEEERALSDKKIYLTECLYSCQQRYKELSRNLNK